MDDIVGQHNTRPPKGGEGEGRGREKENQEYTCLTHSYIHSDVIEGIPHLQAASYFGPPANLHNKWVTFLVNLSMNLAPRTKHKFLSSTLSFSSYCETQNRNLSNPGKGV